MRMAIFQILLVPIYSMQSLLAVVLQHFTYKHLLANFRTEDLYTSICRIDFLF